MTDYYPLISKAAAALEKNTDEARRVLYEHARTALVRQLRNLNRPFTGSDVARERLALEEAIRKVEAEMASCLRVDPIRRDILPTPGGPAPVVDPPHWPAPPPMPPGTPLPQREPPPPPRREPPPLRREQAIALLCHIVAHREQAAPTPLPAALRPNGPTALVDPPHRPAPPPMPAAIPLPQSEPLSPPRQEPPRSRREQAPVAQVEQAAPTPLPAALRPGGPTPMGDPPHRLAPPPLPAATPLPQREPPSPPRREPPPPRREQVAPRIEQAAPTLRPAAPLAQGEAAAAVAEAADQPRPPAPGRNRVFGDGRQGAATQSVPAALLEFESPTAARIEAPVKPAARSVVRTIVPAVTTAVSAANRVFGGRSQAPATQPMLPALLEFESPTAALIEAPVKPAARSILRTVVSAVIASTAVAALFPMDMVVTGSGRVVSLQPTTVVQPLETAIVRAINVREGQTVRAGEVLARLDPTFSAADVSALQAQVKSFQAEVDRLTAEASGTPYQPTSADASTALQVAIYGQRQAQYRHQMESYNQKISGLQAQLTRYEHDVKAFGERVQIASVMESKRRELERLQVGSQMNRMIAEDQRIEMQRNLTDAQGAAERARRDLQQMIAERDGFEQQWNAKIGEDLTLRTRSLSDASESLRKATLRRELVDLRADQDAVVLTVAKVSVGSVMQSGEQLITLVPTSAPLEVETRIAAADAGYVHPGQKVAIKFDTFPYVQYGMAEGTVRFISPDSFSGEKETQRGSVVTQEDSSAVFFKARVAIDEFKMHGVPGGFQLKPGMTVTADIKAGERTMLTYLFARVLPVGLEGMREP